MISKRILIVDDDLDFRESLGEILEFDNYSVFLAQTKNEGLQILNDESPQVALVDLHLGQSNGIDVIREFKSIDPHLICLVVTAHVDVETALKAVKIGAHDYLRKPLSGEELLAAMDRCYDLIELEQKNKEAEQSILIKNQELEDINKRLKDTVLSSSRFNEQTDYYELQITILKEFKRNFPDYEIRQFSVISQNGLIQEVMIDNREDHPIKWQTNEKPILDVLLTGESYILNDLTELCDSLNTSVFGHSEGTYLLIPLMGKASITGCICLYKTEAESITRYDREIANILASVSSSSLRSLKVSEELKDAEYRNSQSQKLEALGRLAGGVAHDFNNMLSAVLGYTELLSLDLEHNHAAKEKLEEIRQAVHHGSSLTRQLLTFSRRNNLPKKTIDINGLLKESTKILTILLGAENILDLKLDDEPCFIYGDPDQIKQILINLVINARDAMVGYGNTLRISTCIKQLNEESFLPQILVKSGTYLELQVSDSGCGMDRDTLNHLFDPFFTTKEPGRGTGLGLSTVFGIVHQIGGYISVKSALEEGTDFLIYLPIINSEIKKERIISETVTLNALNKNILLIEDDIRIREILNETLRFRGMHVQEAENGIQGLELYKKNPDFFDLVITDIIMPGMRGDQLAEEILNIRPQQKLIYMSGFSTESLVDNDMIHVSKENFLQKPFSNETLLNMVQNYLCI